MGCKLLKKPLPPTRPVEKRQAFFKMLMGRANINQRQLASYLQISQMAVSNMVNGKTRLTAERGKQLRHILRMTDEEYLSMMML